MSIIRDIIAPKDRIRIEWVRGYMPLLNQLEKSGKYGV